MRRTPSARVEVGSLTVAPASVLDAGDAFHPNAAQLDVLARKTFGGGHALVIGREGNAPVVWHFPARAAALLERARALAAVPLALGVSPLLDHVRPAPVDPELIDRLGQVVLRDGERVQYRLHGEVADHRTHRRGWQQDGHYLSPHFALTAEAVASEPELLNRLLEGVPAVPRRSAVHSARDLAWALVPREVALAPVPEPPPRVRVRPSSVNPLQLPLGRDENGGLIGMPVTQLTSGFVFGRSGYGKSTLLADAIVHFGRHWRGDGLIVLDPHSDLVERCRPWLRDRSPIDIDLGDHGQPAVSWNPLAPMRPAPDHVTIRSVVNGLAGALMWQGRYRRLLSAAALSVETLLALNRLLPPELASTLFEAVPLLVDESWRAEILARLPDQAPAWAAKQSAEAVSGIVSILQELRREPAAATFFGRSVSSFDPRTALDGGQVVLVKPGRSVAYLSANLLLAGFVGAALGRADTPPVERRHARLVIDEAQVYGSALAGQIVVLLEQARKFGVGVLTANQSPLRLPENLLHAAMTNHSLLAAFALGASDARLLAAHMNVEAERIVLLAKHRLLAAVERGHAGGRGEPAELTSILPEALFGMPGLDAEPAALPALPAAKEADVQRELRERPARIVQYLEETYPASVPVRVRPYADRTPAERRRLARTMIAEGHSQRAVAREFGISKVTLQRWLGRLDHRGRKWTGGRPGLRVQNEEVK